MNRMIILGVIVALLLGAAGTYTYKVYNKGRDDTLDEIQIETNQSRIEDINERKERVDEINRASDSELLDRACRGGMLPASACK